MVNNISRINFSTTLFSKKYLGKKRYSRHNPAPTANSTNMKLTALLLLASIFITSFPLTSSLVPITEINALRKFYQFTGGSKWKQPTNWLQGDPCENKWYGIFCNIENTHVIEVFPNPRNSGKFS